MAGNRRPELQEVADGVIVATGTHVSWVLLVDGSDVTLVDCGYIGNGDMVRASLDHVTGPGASLSAIVLTHAHVDHLGIAAQLRAANDIPVLVHENEAAHARGEVIEQITPGQIYRRIWRPRMFKWALDIVREGATKPERVKDPLAFQANGALDVAGEPVPIPTPGHTSGHCAYHLPEKGVLIVGDALATGHALSRRQGPQLLPPFFDHDRAKVIQSLKVLESLPADVVVPGHGPPFRGTPAEAVRQALANA
jgi:glyoxylase-like metal-dependent hydrolase (beta-lactamase superfamily II)